MSKIFTFKRSEYWGTGHWLVTYPEGNGRVSQGADGKWSAFNWITPINGIKPRAALADGLSTRADAAIVLRTVAQVADALERETEELIKRMEGQGCGHF